MEDREPPPTISLTLSEALDLLSDLEDARDALIDSQRLVVVVAMEARIRLVSRKLGFQDPEGGLDVG